jgi:hypothetical protein
VTRSKSEAVYVGRDSFRMGGDRTPEPETGYTPVSGAFYPMGQPQLSPLLLPPTRPTQPPVQMVRALKLSKSVFAGVCLSAFAAGIVTKVVIDRFMLRQGNDAPVLSEQAPAPPAPRQMAPEFQALPPPEPARPSEPEVEPLAPTPVKVAAPTPAKAVVPTPTKAVARASNKGAAAHRAAKAQRNGRTKRPPSVASATTNEPAPSWNDPFGK